MGVQCIELSKVAFKEASLDEERFLRQKSKIEWLKAGDANTAYFRKIVKISHYEQFLGLEGASTPLDDQRLFTQILANHKAEFMVRDVLDREIKYALFFIGDDKAPGLDGFTAAFFKSHGILWVRRVQIAEDFQYHHLCKKQRIVNLCFADDLFLFARGEMKKGKAKVAWEAVCLPHCEGGLGIRRLDDFNVSLMATHEWCILINKESLLVQWIHSYKLKGRSFWDVSCVVMRSTSMWLDRWVDSCTLRDMLTVRNIVRSGFSLSNTEKLKAQDRLWQWDVGLSIDLNLLRYPLCDMVPGSYSHLFFECSIASQVWFQVRSFIGMSFVPPLLMDVLAFLIPSKGSSVSNVISRIVLAATTYCLWNERNSRLFKKKKLTADQIVQLITSLVRMKLVTFKFKKMSTGSR
nr:reverse transcriptase domain, reverse transcriptase zinc-binding domain protein [Tanacetum cinerariifolium]